MVVAFSLRLRMFLHILVNTVHNYIPFMNFVMPFIKLDTINKIQKKKQLDYFLRNFLKRFYEVVIK